MSKYERYDLQGPINVQLLLVACTCFMDFWGLFFKLIIVLYNLSAFISGMYTIPACSNWSYFYISSRRGVDLFINKMCSKNCAIVLQIGSCLFSFLCNCVHM